MSESKDSAADEGWNDDQKPQEWLHWMEDDVQSQVAFGDTKAGLLLTADSILIAAMGATVTGESPLVGHLAPVSRWGLGVAFISLFIALLVGLYTILPNRKNLWPQGHDHARNGRTSFGWIASHEDNAEYVEYCRNVATLSLNEELARTVHGRASWAYKKFRRLYFAISATIAGVVFASAVAIFEAVRTLFP
ncbi:hypothetical protein GCM10009777_36160 [Microbacterium pumilum]|uniref:Pycsar effector protein domain-containing protein n=2 Tax=Microbacterium pumilum TaxID=344165 RepID=A0ABN2T151_9MICO